jgi:hypothetical protein
MAAIGISVMKAIVDISMMMTSVLKPCAALVRIVHLHQL